MPSSHHKVYIYKSVKLHTPGRRQNMTRQHRDLRKTSVRRLVKNKTVVSPWSVLCRWHNVSLLARRHSFLFGLTNFPNQMSVQRPFCLFGRLTMADAGPTPHRPTECDISPAFLIGITSFDGRVLANAVYGRIFVIGVLSSA